MLKLFSIILFIFISYLPNNYQVLHPVHISVTNIEYNKNTKKFAVSIKLFTDDFERALSKNTGKATKVTDNDIITGKNINHYINRRLIIRFANKIQKLKFVRKTVKDNNTTWLYYEFVPTNISGKILITNKLMFNLYSDQKNLLIYSYLNIEEAYKFDENNYKFEISF